MNEFFSKFPEYFIYFNDEILWGYIGFWLIFSSIIYLTFKSRFLQVTRFPTIIKYFIASSRENHPRKPGTSSLKVFFASLGGCIGIGNLATVAVAIKVGGPGALFWVCVVSFFGSIIKYSEIFLGLKYRVPNAYRGYEGGPMYYLKKAFPKFPLIASLFSFFLCIYGTDIYMFTVIKTSIVSNFDVPNTVVIIGLLLIVMISVIGGIERVGSIATIFLPIFMVVYTGMSLWVFIENSPVFPEIVKSIFSSAFTGHAAVGGFAGSTFLLTVSKGISSSAYASDLGTGLASVLQTEVSSEDKQKQAGLAIFVVFLNTFIVCLCSMLLVLVTGAWMSPIMDGGLLIQEALTRSFSNMQYFMPFFLFAVGYPSLISSLLVGVKAARFIHPYWGDRVYYMYATSVFIIFSYFSSYYALIFLVLAGGFLNVMNISGILKLRKQIDFNL
jgi:AGCS family alanine or glycine:cation symporter